MAASWALCVRTIRRTLRPIRTTQRCPFSSSARIPWPVICGSIVVVNEHVNGTRWISGRGDSPPFSVPRARVDPFAVAKENLFDLVSDIRRELDAPQQELKILADYYFLVPGKNVRPTTVVLMARALNAAVHSEDNQLLPNQRKISLISEMIHTATLMHDDVIDSSATRRGKDSINVLWGQRKAILGGDFVLASAAQMVSRIKNNEVTAIFAEVLMDLVQGEMLQLGAKERENDRFSHYLLTIMKKTASLFANSCKAVAILGGVDNDLQNLAFEYGRNVGLAFQLVDDVLDFESTSFEMGKPTAVDLKLGLATAPVLFACEKFPELNSMIMRRFNQPGDVELAFEAVFKSDGIYQTRLLAERHVHEAIKLAEKLPDCIEQHALCVLPEIILHRSK